jgi:phenylacetate-CoA ligase
MEKVTGRSDDMIILRGVNVFPTQIEEILLTVGACSGHYQIELTREGRMDEMTVHAEIREDAYAAVDINACAAAILGRIKDTVGITTRIELHAPGGIERSATGKARRIVDRRPKG